MSHERLRCSFCGRASSAKEIIAGPNGVYICNACVALCVEIFDENGVTVSLPGRRSRLLALRRAFQRKRHLGVNEPEITRVPD
jgi:ATP-dependent protease Clp ATPase subunit